jgi:hypothetical protein
MPGFGCWVCKNPIPPPPRHQRRSRSARWGSGGELSPAARICRWVRRNVVPAATATGGRSRGPERRGPRHGGSDAPRPGAPPAGANRSSPPRRSILDRHRRGVATQVSHRPPDLGPLPPAGRSRPPPAVWVLWPCVALPARGPTGGACPQAGASALGRGLDPSAVGGAIPRAAGSERADPAALVPAGGARAGPAPSAAGAAGAGPGGARGVGDRCEGTVAAGGWEWHQCAHGDR